MPHVVDGPFDPVEMVLLRRIDGALGLVDDILLSGGNGARVLGC